MAVEGTIQEANRNTLLGPEELQMLGGVTCLMLKLATQVTVSHNRNNYSPRADEHRLGTRDNGIVDEDQITPLPMLARRRSTRLSNRPTSIVSIYTESEIQALAEFMSDIADLGDSSHRSEPSSPVMLSKSEPIASLDSASYSTTTISDSDQEHPSYINRNRPPRILTESHRSPPSLTSTSHSSLSTDHHVPSDPITPLTSVSELASSDLAMIDEIYPQFDPDNLDPFNSTQDLPGLPEAWPQHKSNIHWTIPSPLQIELSPPIIQSPTIQASNSDHHSSPGSLHAPLTSRNASTVSFTRFLSRSRKHSISDEIQAAMLEEKRLKKALKKEQSQAKKEKANTERRKREEQAKKHATGGQLGEMHPLLLGTMLAMGQ